MLKKEEYYTEVEEIEKEEDNTEYDDISNNEIVSFNASYSLPEFSKKLKEKVFYKPKFQRNSIWDNRRKSRFIESLIFAYPVPPVFLYKNPKEEQYIIVDGFQRIDTINSFLNNDFALKQVSNSIKDCFFNDLSIEYRRILENRQLSCVIIRQVIPDKQEILYNIFERLNTGGQNLNNMEIRRAIYYGKLMQELEKINEDVNWRKILGKQEIHERFLDVELILRVLAFSEKWNNAENFVCGYTNSIKPFLNLYTIENRNKNIDAFKEKFLNITEQIINELGEKPFTPFKKVNYVLLDSIMTALIIRKNKVIDLKTKKRELENDNTFKEIYEAKQGTLSPKNVNNRIKIALDYLK